MGVTLVVPAKAETSPGKVLAGCMTTPLILSLSKGTRENGNPYPNRKPVVPA